MEHLKNSKKRLGTDTRGSAGKEYVIAIGAVGLLGLGGFGVFGGAMQNAIDGNAGGTAAATATAGNGVAPAPSVGGEAAAGVLMNVDVSLSCTTDPEACEAIIQERTGERIDCGASPAVCEAAIAELANGEVTDPNAGEPSDEGGGGGGMGIGDVVDAFLPGHGFTGPDGFFSRSPSDWILPGEGSAFSLATDFADWVLPGEGLNPLNVLDGVLPGHGFGTDDGFLAWGGDVLDQMWPGEGLMPGDVLDGWLPGTGFFGDDGFFSKSPSDWILPGEGGVLDLAGDFADWALPGEGLNPINIADGFLPGHGFFGDDGLLSWGGDVLGGAGGFLGGALDTVMPGHGFTGEDGLFSHPAWLPLGTTLFGLPATQLVSTLFGDGSAIDDWLPGHGYMPGNIIDGVLPGHGFFGDSGFLPSWFPGQSIFGDSGVAKSVGSPATTVPVDAILSNANAAATQGLTLLQVSNETKQPVPANLATAAQANIDAAQEDIVEATVALQGDESSAAAVQELDQAAGVLAAIESELANRAGN